MKSLSFLSLGLRVVPGIAHSITGRQRRVRSVFFNFVN